MALPHTRNIFDYPPRFQFRQPDGAPCGGQSCCTDTCLQMIVDFYKDTHYSLWTIRKRAQNRYAFDERPCTGLNHLEVLNGLRQFGIGHYQVSFGVGAEQVWNRVATGPVLVPVHYGSYPTARGRCNSNKAEVEGKTDCGFNGSHAVLVIGRRYHTVNGSRHRDFFVRDPDHNSPSRPEKPRYDRITFSDLNRAMRNIIPYTAFKNTYMAYPTQRK